MSPEQISRGSATEVIEACRARPVGFRRLGGSLVLSVALSLATVTAAGNSPGFVPIHLAFSDQRADSGEEASRHKSRRAHVLRALERHVAAFNSHDREVFAAALHYPHIKVSTSQDPRISKPIVYDTARDYADGMNYRPVMETGWDHTTIVSKDAIHVGRDKAHIAGRWIRYKAEGTPILENQVTYVAMKGESVWGMASRFNVGPPLESTVQIAEIGQQAVKAVTDTLRALSKDRTEFAASLNYPHVRLEGSRLRFWENEHDCLDALEELGPEWRTRRLGSVSVVQISTDAVALDVAFQETEGGDAGWAVYLVTKEGNRWGVRAVSSIEADSTDGEQ